MRSTPLILASCCLFLACAPKMATHTTSQLQDTGAAKATDFTLRSIDGRSVRLSDYLGKDVVLLNFWATWCVPCLGEMPELEKLHQKYKDQGLTIIGISMDGPETVANVDSTVRRYGVSYPVVLDEETRVVAAYNPTRDAPFAVLIDRTGRIVETTLGYAPGDEVELEQKLQVLLGTSANAATN
jgi:peroxiredoxin